MEKVVVPAEEGLAANAGQKNADNTPTVQEVVGRPEWLPENFESVEAFLASNKELRADHTRKSQELAELKKTALPSDEGKDEGDDTPTDEKKADAGEQYLPGVDNDTVKDISDYAWENGNLTDDHYSKLEAAGYSREVVDQYMAGQIQQAAGAQDAILNAGGGPEAVQSMFDWAQSSLDADTVDNYNSKFAAGGADAIMAMEHLKARYHDSGVAPAGQRVVGANAPGTPTATYKSIAEMSSDMSDPRYKTDPAFRASVAAKLNRSNIL